METWESEGTDWEDKNPTNVHLVSVFFHLCEQDASTNQ